ncbi:Rid family hydrolase [Sphingobium cloacae]|uniref:Uncharacterized protein n=1 Tax=Sphingobium cloacae TaxID=120107 RepID=A0A1E1EXU5_9SPHN|nr:Rid family hydrolase [Sphingobium cloacae]BAV63087.1 hypothetical protein SCLO_1000470 [Sphingobium cloacae]
MTDLIRLSSGSRFEELAAYSRAVVDDRYVHLSGTVGGDPATGVMPEDVTEQMDNIFRVVTDVLDRFGIGLDAVVRTRVFLTDMEHLMPVAAGLRARFADCPPANTTLLCGIPALGAKVEIEITARVP